MVELEVVQAHPEIFLEVLVQLLELVEQEVLVEQRILEVFLEITQD
jgi:hypothetical protein